VLELRGALVRYLRVKVSDREAALPQVAAPESAPSGVLPPPTLLLLRETLYQARHHGRSSGCFTTCCESWGPLTPRCPLRNLSALRMGSWL